MGLFWITNDQPPEKSTASAARLLLRRLRPAAARVAHGGATSTGWCAGHVFGGAERAEPQKPGDFHGENVDFTGKNRGFSMI